MRVADRVLARSPILCLLAGARARLAHCRRFLIECPPAVPVLERILAHLGCKLLLLGPRTTGLRRLASESRGAGACVAVLVCSRRSGHACALGCESVAGSRVCIAPLLELLPRHRRLTAVRLLTSHLLLAEEEVLVASASNLQIYHVPHVLVIFQSMHVLFLLLRRLLLLQALRVMSRILL